MPLTKEERRDYNREWMRNNRKKNPQYYREQGIRLRTDNPAKRLIRSTKNSARDKHLEHTITEEDLILPEYCPYLNLQINYNAGTGKHMLNPSVDRIDPTKGYVKGNVEVISNLANTMKCNASKELLIRFAKTILARYDCSD